MPRLVRRKVSSRLEYLEARIAPASLPTGFVENQITGQIAGATAMEFAPDGKLFVLEQTGKVEVYQGSGASWTQVAPTPPLPAAQDPDFFLGNALTVDSFFERGLLGITFHPNYMSNRYLYVYYTVPAVTSPPAAAYNRISRFEANAAGTQVVPGSELPIVQLNNLSAGNHNGGAIHFGPDGKLYVAVGENAQPNNAQLLTTRHGKMLRYNDDGTIPADNPATIANLGATSGANRAIWAAGLRNPFTFTFHPTSGLMHINDVGQNAWEEINVGVAGANYGWSTTEGRFTPTGGNANFTNPIVSYHHTNGANNYPTGNNYTGFAITGGAFYVSPVSPFPQDYVGDYFFADYVSDFIKRFDAASNTVINFATSALGTVDLKVGSDGCLYYLARDANGSGVGRVLRVNFTGSAAPYIVAPPSNQSVSAGLPATFTVMAGGPAPLSYQWRRNNVDILGATSSSYTLPSTLLSDNGALFGVRVTNPTSNVTSANATLTVNANQSPTPTILTPVVDTHVSYGDTINFSGSATDPEDGALPASAFTWRIDYFTGGEQRPFMPSTPGITSGSFAIPTVSPYTLPNVFFRVFLSVQDSFGNVTEVTRDLLPNTAQVTLQTNPAGIGVLLDGTPLATPHNFVGVTGQTRSLGATSGATSGGFAYGFVSWSDGGALVHDISTPAADTTYTANYALRPPRVSDLLLDNGSGQRSMIRNLDVVFDAIMTYTGSPSTAFTLSGPSGSVPFNIGAIDNTAGYSVIRLTFPGPGLDGASLADGVYTFMVNDGNLADGLNQILDGDENGSVGGLYSDVFRRLYGDADGDGHVNLSDFAVFRTAYGTNSLIFDVNGDGTVDLLDFGRFRTAFVNSP